MKRIAGILKRAALAVARVQAQAIIWALYLLIIPGFAFVFMLFGRARFGSASGWTPRIPGNGPSAREGVDQEW